MLELGRAAARLGMSLEDALHEKTNELRARLFYLCKPNDLISRDQVATYLSRILQFEPSQEFVEAVRTKPREPRLRDEQLAVLEMKQRMRCALCGTKLRASAHYHVDHIKPVALGGVSREGNFQLLCFECNQGKGALLDWIVGAQYQKDRLDSRMRYCALARAQGQCSAARCDAGAATHALKVVQKVSRADGGREVLDNLRVVCEEHDPNRRRLMLARARRASARRAD